MRETDLETAIAVLETGCPIIFPTDTVYGLGVAVKHATSPGAIYDLKLREADKPIAWLVGGIDALGWYGRSVDARVRDLAERYWPGALTIIVEASDEVPIGFRSRMGTVGLRMPDSELALSLIEAAGPLATSSANIAGMGAPRTLAQVDPRLLGRVDVVLGDDTAPSGVASTVIDASNGAFRVLRQGAVKLCEGYECS